MSISVEVSWKIACPIKRKNKNKKKLCQHHITSIVCTLIKIALDQSAHKKSLEVKIPFPIKTVFNL